MLSEFQPNWLNNTSKLVEFPKKWIVPEVRCCPGGGVGNSGAWPDIQRVCSGRKYNGDLLEFVLGVNSELPKGRRMGDSWIQHGDAYLEWRKASGLGFSLSACDHGIWKIIFFGFFYTPRINFIIQLLYVHPAKQLLGFSLVTAWLPVYLPQFSTQRFPYRMDGGVTSSSNRSFKE